MEVRELIPGSSFPFRYSSRYLEVPSNMLLKKFKRPSYYLGVLVLCWGIVMTCTGFVQNFSGLVAVRFLLGLFECV